MEIYPDPTHMLLLGLPFLVALAALHVILWRPLLEWLDEREDTSRKARDEASQHRAAAADSLSSIEAQLAAARSAAAEVRHAARERAQQQDAARIAEARAQADTRIAEAIESIRGDRLQASEALKAATTALSNDIAERVLPHGAN